MGARDQRAAQEARLEAQRSLVKRDSGGAGSEDDVARVDGRPLAIFITQNNMAPNALDDVRDKHRLLAALHERGFAVRLCCKQRSHVELVRFLASASLLVGVASPGLLVHASYALPHTALLELRGAAAPESGARSRHGVFSRAAHAFALHHTAHDIAPYRTARGFALTDRENDDIAAKAVALLRRAVAAAKSERVQRKAAKANLKVEEE